MLKKPPQLKLSKQRVLPSDPLFDVLPTRPASLDWSRDRLLIGAYAEQFKQGDPKTHSPYDYLTDPVTGKRNGEQKEPWGHRMVDLTKGIQKFTVLPPLEVWKAGCWASDLTEEQIKRYPSIAYKQPEELYRTWLTTGEGTPNNYVINAYYCPLEVTKTENPRHPLMWRKELREVQKATSSYGFGVPPHYGQGGYGGYDGNPTPTKSVTPVTPAKPSAPPLPAGVRFRCTINGGCGHWFKEDQLRAHKTVCPAQNEGFNDWAIMCAPECGCETLDQASAYKPGFPRKTTQGEEVNEMSIMIWIKGHFNHQEKTFTVGDKPEDAPEHVVDAWRAPNGAMTFDDPMKVIELPKPEEVGEPGQPPEETPETETEEAKQAAPPEA